MENKGVFGRNLDSRRNISDLDSLKKTFLVMNQNLVKTVWLVHWILIKKS